MKSSFRNVFILLSLTLSVWAQAALDIPSLSSPVMDEAGLLSAATKQQLESSLLQFRQSQNVQLQVYIIKSLQNESIESAAIQIFDRWKLGDEKTDKGLLFLVAPNEKRMRIEVGQGLEGDLPDVIGKRIISDVVRPYFQREEFGLGILQGVQTVQNYIVNADVEQKAQWKKEAEQGSSKKGNSWIIFIVAGVWILIFMFNPSLALHILFAAMSNSGRGGGGGGGSWSGGGGRSSGGGASGGW